MFYRLGVEFLAVAQICCVLLLKNMLYTTIIDLLVRFLRIKSFHSTVCMYFCPQKNGVQSATPYRSQDVYSRHSRIRDFLLKIFSVYSQIQPWHKMNSITLGGADLQHLYIINNKYLRVFILGLLGRVCCLLQR